MVWFMSGVCRWRLAEARGTALLIREEPDLHNTADEEQNRSGKDTKDK